MTSASSIAYVDDDYVDHYRYYYDANCEKEGAGGEAGEEEGEGEGDDAETPLARLMDRGHRLRLLRLLALEDERARTSTSTSQRRREGERRGGAPNGRHLCEEEEKKEDGGGGCDFDDVDVDVDVVGVESWGEDVIRVMPDTNETVLDYDSYLAHQRYHDDLKHVDHNYIDYGDLAGGGGGGGGRRLVVEQRKRLGKGGLCWDAAFVLGEHVARDAREWNGRRGGYGTRVMELGAGTGLCGLMIAASVPNCDVEITDLPELQDLMRSNVSRNFGDPSSAAAAAAGEDGDEDDDFAKGAMTVGGGGRVSSRVLRWGVEDDYGDVPYDVVIGADVVTSLYDPVALARTFHALSGPYTRIYVSGKARLDKPHEVFEGEIERLFARVRKVERPCSRLRSPNVFVIVADGKR